MPLNNQIKFLEDMIVMFEKHQKEMIERPSFAILPKDKQKKYKSVLETEIRLLEEDIARLKKENEVLHSQGYIDIENEKEDKED